MAPRRLWSLVVVVGILECADAALTLYALHRGAVELNPLMDAALRHGPITFVLGKLSCATLGVALLVKCRKEWALWCAAAINVGVVGWSAYNVVILLVK